MNTRLAQAIEHKVQARRHWQSVPFADKIAALIRMQGMAQEMAQASGRRFDGVVWKTGVSPAARRE